MWRIDQWLLKHLVAIIAAQEGTLVLKLLSTTVDLKHVSSLWVFRAYQLFKVATMLNDSTYDWSLKLWPLWTSREEMVNWRWSCKKWSQWLQWNEKPATRLAHHNFSPDKEKTWDCSQVFQKNCSLVSDGFRALAQAMVSTFKRMVGSYIFLFNYFWKMFENCFLVIR